jgi:hypothetical protein
MGIGFGQPLRPDLTAKIMTMAGFLIRWWTGRQGTLPAFAILASERAHTQQYYKGAKGRNRKGPPSRATLMISLR